MIAVVALVVSLGLLAGVVFVLVSLRRGAGPSYSASRLYDANCREAVRVLTGEDPDHVPGEQWYDPARVAARGDPDEAERFRGAVRDALGATLPETGEPAAGPDGTLWLSDERVRVVPAISTAELRRSDLERWSDARLVIGIVLFNPEPPGGPATRVTLPVQALFGALERRGRGDLVHRFEDLKEAMS